MLKFITIRVQSVSRDSDKIFQKYEYINLLGNTCIMQQFWCIHPIIALKISVYEGYILMLLISSVKHAGMMNSGKIIPAVLEL